MVRVDLDQVRPVGELLPHRFTHAVDSVVQCPQQVSVLSFDDFPGLPISSPA